MAKIVDLNFTGVSGSTVPNITGNADGAGKKGAIGSEVSWNPTTTIDGSGHTAVVFDGTQLQRIELPNTASFLNVTNYTVLARLTLDASIDTDPAHQRYEIMEKGGSFWFNIREDSTPKYLMRTGGYFGGGGGDLYLGTNPIPSGTTVIVAAVYDGAHLSTYIANGDGSNLRLDQSVAKTGTLATGATKTGVDENLVVGAKHTKGGTEILEGLFNGSMSMFRIYDTALTIPQMSAEIAANTLDLLIIPVERGTGTLAGTQSDWNNSMVRIKNIWETASYGQFALNYTFANKVSITGSATNNPDEIRGQVLPKLASTQPNIQWWNYDAIFYYIGPDNIQETTSMGEMFVGAGSLGPTFPTVAGWNVPEPVHHEFGHILGLNHSGQYTGNPFTLAGLATVENSQGNQEQYGDAYSPMGGNDYLTQPTMFERQRLSWTGGRIKRVTAAGTYTLDPRSATVNVNPTVLVVNGQSGMEYWIEYPKRGADEAHDSGIPSASGSFGNPAGVTIRVRGFRPSTSTDPVTIAAWLINQAGYFDPTPQFAAGQSFTDPGSGTRLNISVTSVGATAVVSITNVVSPSTIPIVNFSRPGAVSDLAANLSGTTVTLTWTLPTTATGPTAIFKDGSLLIIVPAGTATYADTNVTTSHNYTVQTSTTTGVDSPPSNLATVTVAQTGNFDTAYGVWNDATVPAFIPAPYIPLDYETLPETGYLTNTASLGSSFVASRKPSDVATQVAVSTIMASGGTFGSHVFDTTSGLYQIDNAVPSAKSPQTKTATISSRNARSAVAAGSARRMYFQVDHHWKYQIGTTTALSIAVNYLDSGFNGTTDKLSLVYDGTGGTTTHATTITLGNTGNWLQASWAFSDPYFGGRLLSITGIGSVGDFYITHPDSADLWISSATVTLAPTTDTTYFYLVGPNNANNLQNRLVTKYLNTTPVLQAVSLVSASGSYQPSGGTVDPNP